jgi:NAD-dependent SIR2 family protein deacetylase
MTCTCGEKMTKYEQPPRFGQTFIFWKCKKCGKMLREEIVGTVNGLGQQTDSRDKPSD